MRRRLVALRRRMRLRWRRLRAAWCQWRARLELWWNREVAQLDPRQRVEFAQLHVIPSDVWETGPLPRYRDGRPDLHVDDLGDGWESMMAAGYLYALAHPVPREVR